MLGIQGASRKVQPPSQETIPWEVTIINAQVGIHGLVFQDIWRKKQRIIAEITSMELEDSEGVHWARMESIRGFLIYVAIKYRYMNPYLKALRLTLDVWIPYRYK